MWVKLMSLTLSGKNVGCVCVCVFLGGLGGKSSTRHSSRSVIRSYYDRVIIFGMFIYIYIYMVIYEKKKPKMTPGLDWMINPPPRPGPTQKTLLSGNLDDEVDRHALLLRGESGSPVQAPTTRGVE